MVIEALVKSFLVNDMFIMDLTKPRICMHVNSLAGWGLALLGYRELAGRVATALLASPCFNAKLQLFHQEMDTNGHITIDAINVCKNVIVALLLDGTGRRTEANQIVDRLYQSPAWDSKLGLFYRQFNPDTQEVTRTVVVHTNAWVALLLHQFKQKGKAREIAIALEREFGGKDSLFSSQHCEQPVIRAYEDKAPNSRITLYSDDQALMVLVFKLVGMEEQTEQMMTNLLNSPLYDKEKSLFHHSVTDGTINAAYPAYKNGLCGLALAATQRRDELHRLNKQMETTLYGEEQRLFYSSSTSQTVIPDNVILALLARHAEEVIDEIAR